MGELAPLHPGELLLVDGSLREATGGGRFDNLNPATEESLGTCADATHADMDAAIAAARRAFDETEWSTDPDFRAHCLTQLRDALSEELETFRSIIVSEAGAPVALTEWYQLDPLVGDLEYWRDQIAT